MVGEDVILNWLVAHGGEASLFLRCLLKVAKWYATRPTRRQVRCRTANAHNVPRPAGRAQTKDRYLRTARKNATKRKKHQKGPAEQLRLFASL
jgi:hypothetical protein